MAALLKRKETRSVIKKGSFLIKKGILIKGSESAGFDGEVAQEVI
jgi:hypothetical protein